MTESSRLFKRRRWQDGIGYTYDGVTPSKCQHYPLCKEGREELVEHQQRLAEQDRP